MRCPCPTQDSALEGASSSSSPAHSAHFFASSPVESHASAFCVAESHSPPPRPPGLFSPPGSPPPSSIGSFVSLDIAVFMNFLASHTDNRGMRQALIWLLDPIGYALVQYGSVVVHRLRHGVDCWARVSSFVMRSATEAMFQTTILGWQTGVGGWRAPGGDIFSYIIVPLVRCAPEFSQSSWRYFEYPQSLQRHAVGIVHNVRAMLSGDPSFAIAPWDWATGWIVLNHLMTPVMKAFEPDLGTGLTITADDIYRPLRDGMSMPPASFYPHGSPPYIFPAAVTSQRQIPSHVPMRTARSSTSGVTLAHLPSTFPLK